MELPGGDGVWLAPSPSPPGPAVPDRHDEHRVGTFIWPPVGTSTWPPVGTFSWPRTGALSGDRRFSNGSPLGSMSSEEIAEHAACDLIFSDKGNVGVVLLYSQSDIGIGRRQQYLEVG